MTIVEFIEARLAEDEAAARLRAPTVFVGTSMTDMRVSEPESRALREVEAKRAILDAHPTADGLSPYERSCGIGMSFGCGTCHQDDGIICGYGWCPTLRALASVWSDHPDYRQEWKP